MSFSKHDPDNHRQDETWDQAVRFSVDRRHNAVVPNPGANNYVRTVDDTESPWTSAAELGAAITFGQAPGALGVAVNSAYARSALRPASRGEGRDRDR